MIMYGAVWSSDAGVFASVYVVHSDASRVLWHLPRNKFVGEEEWEGEWEEEVCRQQLG